MNYFVSYLRLQVKQLLVLKIIKKQVVINLKQIQTQCIPFELTSKPICEGLIDILTLYGLLLLVKATNRQAIMKLF